MGERYLIDTCTVVKMLVGNYPEKALEFIAKVIDDEAIISFITQIELLVAKPSGYEDLKTREQFVNGAKIEYINSNIIDEAIYIRRTANIKLPDAIIAATAKHFDYTLISCNYHDFKKVTSLGVKYINPETDLI